MLATNHPPVNKAAAEANIATILLDLFFKYSLNNFLHAQVKKVLIYTSLYNIGNNHNVGKNRKYRKALQYLQVESCLRSILFWKEKAVKAEETEPTLESRFCGETK